MWLYVYNIIFLDTVDFFMDYHSISYIGCISITCISSISICFTQTSVLPNLCIVLIAEIPLVYLSACAISSVFIISIIS